MSNKDKVDAFFAGVHKAVDSAYEAVYGALDSAMVELDKFIDAWHKEALRQTGAVQGEEVKVEPDSETKRQDLIKYFKHMKFDSLVNTLENDLVINNPGLVDRAWEALTPEWKSAVDKEPGSPL